MSTVFYAYWLGLFMIGPFQTLPACQEAQRYQLAWGTQEDVSDCWVVVNVKPQAFSMSPWQSGQEQGGNPKVFFTPPECKHFALRRDHQEILFGLKEFSFQNQALRSLFCKFWRNANIPLQSEGSGFIRDKKGWAKPVLSGSASTRGDVIHCLIDGSKPCFRPSNRAAGSPLAVTPTGLELRVFQNLNGWIRPALTHNVANTLNNSLRLGVRILVCNGQGRRCGVDINDLGFEFLCNGSHPRLPPLSPEREVFEPKPCFDFTGIWLPHSNPNLLKVRGHVRTAILLVKIKDARLPGWMTEEGSTECDMQAFRKVHHALAYSRVPCDEHDGSSGDNSLNDPTRLLLLRG